MSRKKHPWYRRRGYPHFDHLISYGDAKNLVSSPSRVAVHSFYPFIEFTSQTFKVKRTAPDGKLKRVPKLRPIAYASHADCHIYSYYSLQLSKKYELELAKRNIQEHVLAFRSLQKSNVDFAFEAFEAIRNFGECSVIALDITGFFSNLDHQKLKDSWAALLGQSHLPPDHYAVFKSLTKYATVNLERLYAILGVSISNRTNKPVRLCTAEDFRLKVRASGLVVQHPQPKGVPQGSPISALLSNIYMLEYDVIISNFVRAIGGLYFRYCDDILLIVPPRNKVDAEAIAVSEIKNLGLEINLSKTEKVDFTASGSVLVASKPLQYLGFLYDGKRILLRSASLARYSARMRSGVRLAKSTMRKRNDARLERGESARPLFKRKLYQQYSHFGRRNFLSYGYDAAKKMNAPSIRKQLKSLWKRFHKEIS